MAPQSRSPAATSGAATRRPTDPSRQVTAGRPAVRETVGGTGEDGQPRVFRDTAVANLSEFFGRFGALNVRSNEQLDELVERAQRAVRGVAAQDLRDSEALRRRVAAQLAGVRSSLDAMLVERPRRRILRQAAPGGA